MTYIMKDTIFMKQVILNMIQLHVNLYNLLQFNLQNIMEIVFYLFIMFINLLKGQNYEINIDFPLLVKNQLTNIKIMACDNQNNFWISLSDGTVRKYNPTFSSYEDFNYPHKVQKFQFGKLTNQYTSLLNGTIFAMITEYFATIYNNSTAISIYECYNNYQFVESYQLNDTIIDFIGYNLEFLQIITSFTLFYCQHSIQFLYKQQIYTLYNYNNDLENHTILLSTRLSSVSFANIAADKIQISVRFYLGLNNSKIYNVIVNLLFQFNYTTSTYDFAAFTVNHSTIVTLAQSIKKIVVCTYFNILLMQSIRNNYYFYDLITGSSGAGSPNMSNFIMKQRIGKYNKEYLLTTTGLIQIYYASNSLILLSITKLLPQNNYLIVRGQYFDLLFIINQPNVYKADICRYHPVYTSPTECELYACFVSDCSLCPINNETCGICESGFSRNSNYTCTSLYSQFILSIKNIEFLRQFLQYLLNLLETMISIPSARAAISPIFYLFGNFDDLYLYQFHDRVYSQVMIDFFNSLNNLEARKWNLVNYSDIISRFTYIDSFNKFTNFQYQYQQFNYSYNQINANQSQGLFSNSQSYFIVVIPITIVYFCFFHIAFRLFVNFSFSKLFRKYYFLLFLLIIQINGNVQQLTFYLAREYLSVFFFTFFNKLLKFVIILYGFFLLFSCCTIFYFARIIYSKASRVLMQPSKNSQLGIFCAIFQLGVRNILLSSLHFYGRFLSEYYLIKCLLACQILIILIIILFLYNKIFKQRFKIILMILLSLVRINLIATFMLDQQGQNQKMSNWQFILIMLMISIFSLGIVIDVIVMIKFYIPFFRRNGLRINRVAHFQKRTQKLNNNGLQAERDIKRLTKMQKQKISHLTKRIANSKLTIQNQKQRDQFDKKSKKFLYKITGKFKQKL